MGRYEDFLAAKRSIDPMTGLDKVGRIPKYFKPHQADITRWALKRGRAAIFAGTGLGKTLMELEWSRQVSKFTGKPVLILAPLAVSTQHVREGDKFGIKAKIVRWQAEADEDVSVTNYHKLEHFDVSQFGGICLDECFASDTPIDIIDADGNACQKHIENIQIGDRILNASGVDIVSDIHRREVPYAVRVRYNGQSVIASPNHPFFTQAGWKGAADLRPGDQIVATATAMRMVQKTIPPEICSGSQNEILREILLSEMAHESAGKSRQNSQSDSSGKTWGQEKFMASRRVAGSVEGDGENSGTQSHVDAGSEREGFPPIERDGPRTFRAWGQRHWFDQTAGGVDGCYVRELGAGICFITGEVDAGLSHELQNRLSQYRHENSHRSGWSLAPIDGAKNYRCQEGCEAFGFMVDGIEVLELGHSDLDRYRDAEGKLYFYDLGATRHPSFSINGALVHNSSILKNVDGHYRTKLIREAAQIPFRLAATATPAPNDFMELGNHAEFLGIMSYTDMLATFFIHDGGDTAKWRLKGHAEDAFWKWMASWAVMLRKPSDLGYDDTGYDLPPLNEIQHTVGVPYAPNIDTGLLFPMEATGLGERIKARRGSINSRVDKAISLTPADRPFVWWCNLNDESASITSGIPGAVELRGSDDDADKERKIVDFIEGRIRVLVTKASICGHGLNLQHCADTGFVGASDSFEQTYQAIRRFWRFGQTKPVNAHFIAAETEGAVVANYRRKEADADRMASAMVRHMADLSAQNVRGQVRDKLDYQPTVKMHIPEWIGAEA